MADLKELQADVVAAATAVERVKADIDNWQFENAEILSIAPQVKSVVAHLEDLKRLERSRRQTYADAIIALHNYNQTKV